MHKRRDGFIDPIVLEKEKACIVASYKKPRNEMMQDILMKHNFHKIWIIEKERHLSISEEYTFKLPKRR